MPKVLIADEISNEGIEILKQALEVSYSPTISADELNKVIGEYDALLVRSRTKVTKDVIKQGKNLKVIGRAGVGVDNIDLDAATEQGVLVINSPEGNTASAAEHTLAIMLSLARQVPSADYSVKEGKWERSSFMGCELFNKTLGLIGLGKVGGRVAQYALALGMKVIVYDPFVTADRAAELNLQRVELEEIWSNADFITVHTPKTRETSNLINKAVLAKMKPTVKIINTARGGIIDEAALAEAIKEGKISGAALDVYDSEPPKDSQLIKLGNKVVLTPHLGASTVEAQYNVAIDLAEQLRDFLLTGMARSPVNLPFMRPELLKGLGRYLWLAEAIGAIASQLSDGSISRVSIDVSGHLAEKDGQPLTVAALKGVFAQRVEGVTYVNAQLVARNHGMQVSFGKLDQSHQYPDELTVTVSYNGSQSIITGTVLAHGEPIITRINDYPISLTPARYMLFTSHRDQPGMVAKVAGLLGEHQINISTMAVARRGVREEAVMVMTLDDPLDSRLITKFTEVTGINKARFVSLNHLK